MLVPFFPESPRWLAKVGRVSEARTVLQATRKDGVEDELGAIVRSVMHDQQHADNNSYLRMLFPRTKSQRELRWRVVLSVWLQIMQELVGIGVITVYGKAFPSTGSHCFSDVICSHRSYPGRWLQPRRCKTPGRIQ